MKGYQLILSVLLLFVVVVVFPVVVWLLLWTQAAQAVTPAAPDIGDVASAFSDSVSPIFAALAFAGLVITALMQREELSMQRKELQESNEAFERTANANEGSGRTLSAQVDLTRLSAQLSASQALYAFYATILSSVDVPQPITADNDRMQKFFNTYKSTIPGYDDVEASWYSFDADKRVEEVVKLKSAMEAQRDKAILDMQRIAGELQRRFTAALEVQEEPQIIVNSVAESDTDSALVKFIRRLERAFGRK